MANLENHLTLLSNLFHRDPFCALATQYKNYERITIADHLTMITQSLENFVSFYEFYSRKKICNDLCLTLSFSKYF